MEFNPTLTFEFKNCKNLLDNLLEEYADFDKNYLKSRFAMNCAFNSWHLTDWTFQEYFKKDPRFKSLSAYQEYIKMLCPELEYMRLITNGTKHCILNNKNVLEKTKRKIGDFDSNDWNRHDFDTTRFIIDIGSGRSIGFEKTVLKTIEFWKKFIENPK